MSWKTPKIDWEAASRFNIDDYNRIIGNISHLRGMALEVYKLFQLASMGPEKSYADYTYADEINTIEANLTALCRNTYPFAIGEGQTYYPNQPTMDWKELNRIESACLLIYKNLIGQIAGRKRLAIRLGGGYF